jgi:hypothetical protein
MRHPTVLEPFDFPKKTGFLLPFFMKPITFPEIIPPDNRKNRFETPKQLPGYQIYQFCGIESKGEKNMILRIKPSCPSCSLRRFAERHPDSLWARIWKWHTGWCPGWKAHQAELRKEDPSSRNG